MDTRAYAVVGFAVAAVCAQAATADVFTFKRSGHESKMKVESIQPGLVDLPLRQIFAPLGFDDNDNVQIVLDGELPSTCYKLGPVTTRVTPADKTIHVHPQAFFYPGAWCAMVSIPYVQTVNVGLLPSGDYAVKVERQDGSVKPAAVLPVAVSTTANPDDYLYAPVTDAFVQDTAAPGEAATQLGHELVLRGSFSSSCMKLVDVKVNVRANQVIEVLPIARMEEKAEGCAQVTSEFTTNVPLEGIPAGRYLIHVRSLNGQAINRVADL